MRNLSRRGLLRALTALGAGAVAGCRKYVGPAPVSLVPSGWNRGEERWVVTTCGCCPAGCGIKVRVFEGRAVKIEGNPDHPVNRGGIGPKGQSGLQVLYHPDRIRGPLRREGPRGSGRWTAITWEAAIGQLAASLRDLRASGEPQGLVVVDGEPRGVVPRLWDRFLQAYGSPNHVSHASTTDSGGVLATTFMQGVAEAPGYDWRDTNYVVGFGVRLFESWCQTIHMSRASSSMHRGTAGRRAKFVHVSPDFSVTAAKADEWIPIEPGTYGALALGLAHVLIRDGLHDSAFIRDHTFGFEGWQDKDGRPHRGFRDLALTDYPPEKVTRITGISTETIERLAREMSAHRPAVALGDGAAAGATNGLGTAMAIHALNALLGGIERPGGVLAQPPVLSSWKPVEADAVARKGLEAERLDGRGTRVCPLGNGSIQNLPEAILSERPYPVRALILYRSNPVFSKPEGTRWVEAIRKVPLVVSCSPLPDESTLWADLVLPDHTYLERWEVVEPAPSSGRQGIGFRQPVVRPHHDTMATGDVLIRLARALGSPVGDAFAWADYREAVTDRLQAVVASGSAGRDASDLDALMKRMQANGGWWTEDYPFERWQDAFQTPSRKFEFYSQTIASRLAALFPEKDALEAHLAERGVVTRGDDLYLPHWEPARFAGEPEQYPFLLLPHRGINYADGGVRHLPWLRELPGAGMHAWEEHVELHADDLRRLDLREGERVWVESPAGRRRMHVRMHAGTRPGTVGLPLGHGPWPPTPEDAGTAGGHGLLAAISDPLAGVLALQATRVRLRKEEA